MPAYWRFRVFLICKVTLCFKVNGIMRDDRVRSEAGIEIHEEWPDGRRRFAESAGVWFTGLPRSGRWREVLGRYALVRAHRDDPMRVAECVEHTGRIVRLSVEICDRAADRLIVLRHAGEPFAVKAID